MERTGWQRTWVRVLLTTLTAAVMLLIFFFSNETADRSDRTSGTFARVVIGIAYPDFDGMPESEQQDIFNVIPYASSVVTGSENEILELVASKLKKNPFFRCCSVMDHSSGNKKVFETKYVLDNPHFKEDALHKLPS